MKKITKVFAVLTCAALAFSFWSCDNGNKVETYTVTYEDGVDDAEIAVPSDSTKYITGDTVTVKFEGIGSRDGYTFAGWKDGTTTYTESGTSTFKMKAADVTLTASWTEKTANTDSSDKSQTETDDKKTDENKTDTDNKQTDTTPTETTTPTDTTNPSNPTVTGDTPTSSENGHLTFTNLTLNEVVGASVENKTVTFSQWGTVYWKYDGIDSYDKIRFTVSSDDASADTDDIKLNLLLGGYNSSSGDLANNEDLIWIDIQRDDKGKALEKTFSIAIDEIKQRANDAANIPLASVSFDSIVIKNGRHNNDWSGSNFENLEWGADWSYTIEKIELFKYDQNKADLLVFDPDKEGYEPPTGTELVEKGGRKFLKVIPDGWNANIEILGEKSVLNTPPDLGGYLYMKAEFYTEPSLNNQNYTMGLPMQYNWEWTDTTSWTTRRTCNNMRETANSGIHCVTDVIDYPSVSALQPYIQNSNWEPTTDKEIYIGRIIATNNKDAEYNPFINNVEDWDLTPYEGKCPVIRNAQLEPESWETTIADRNVIYCNPDSDSCMAWWNLNSFADWADYDVVTFNIGDANFWDGKTSGLITIKVPANGKDADWNTWGETINVNYQGVEESWKNWMDVTVSIADLKKRFSDLGVKAGEEAIGFHTNGSDIKGFYIRWIIFGKYAHKDDLVLFDPGADGFIAPEGTSVEEINGEKYLKVTSDASNGKPIALSKTFDVTKYQGFKAKCFVADKTENNATQYGFGFMLSYDENHDSSYDDWVQNIGSNDSVKNIETELKSQPIRCRYNDEVKVNEIRYWANKNGYNGDWTDIGGKTFYIGKVVAYTER
ncbi:MAG: hypothetical protein MR739_12700 [Spirochaetia bacterium]|nr:hypothetical protein [Spirochaetia bacterium]